MYLKNSQGNSGLPDAGDTRDEHEPGRVALGGGVEELLDEPQLVVPPGEGRLETARALRACDRGGDPGGLEDPDRLGLALELMDPDVDVGDGGGRGGPRRLVHTAAARRRDRLDARRRC